MKTEALYEKWGCGYRGVRVSPQKLESIRRALSGRFFRRTNGGLWEPTGNLVVNEGLDHFLQATLAGGTQISTWYLAAVKTNTAAAATMTYATPVYTEIVGSDVSESTRAVWTPGAVASQSVTNNASRGQYTAAGSLTIYASALVGGGSAPSTIGDDAGGGVLMAYGLFSSGSKALGASDVVELAYEMGSADDGV